MQKYEVIKFKDNEFEMDVNVSPKEETVWLTQNEISQLFDTTKQNVSLHINKAFKEKEFDKKSVVKDFFTTASDGKLYKTKHYNLDVIISVGYRVKSNRGVIFRRWANKVLKEYLIEGYSVNNKRLIALNKTIEIQNKMLANTLDIETNELENIINLYTNALTLLDHYDHQCVPKPIGSKENYALEYNECRKFINNMRFNNDSKLFGKEKNKGQLEGILACINQTAFGEDVYNSLEEKAANLLYFIVKDHPFVDGCKRIAAGLFLLYLSKNALLNKSKLVISSGALTALTLLVAESDPKEKEIMVRVVMNILFNKM